MVDRTRNDIVRAFNSLIIKYDMTHITVEMIVKKSGISKATFYRYFKDKYDVMNYNYKALLDEFSSPNASTSYLDLYKHLFDYGKKHWKFLQRAFDTQGTNSLSEYIATYSQELEYTITKQNRKGKSLTEAEKMQLDVFTVGISVIYSRYIDETYKLDPDKAALALYQIMPETLREMWWK